MILAIGLTIVLFIGVIYSLITLSDYDPDWDKFYPGNKERRIFWSNWTRAFIVWFIVQLLLTLGIYT